MSGTNAFRQHNDGEKKALPAPRQEEQKLPFKTLSELSLELLVLREVYAFEKEHRRWPMFNEMANSLSSRGLATRDDVSMAQDMLMDSGQLDEAHVKLEDGRFGITGFAICKHAAPFAKFVFEKTEGLPLR